VLGLLLVLILDLWPPRRYLRPFLAVGFIGSFTTFSTWMVEVGELVSGGSPLIAVLYLSGSLTAGLAATGLGLLVGRAVARRRRKISGQESR
jgi:CrcB protein